jgi:5-methylcytosine-specific restriction endonuclease McrA
MPPQNPNIGRQGRTWRKLCERVRRHQSVCWLCGKPIDKTLPHTDRMAFTVDHVIPRTVDPSLALVYDNLRAAHLSCNSSKGNGNGDNVKTRRSSRDW